MSERKNCRVAPSSVSTLCCGWQYQRGSSATTGHSPSHHTHCSIVDFGISTAGVSMWLQACPQRAVKGSTSQPPNSHMGRISQQPASSNPALYEPKRGSKPLCSASIASGLATLRSPTDSQIFQKSLNQEHTLNNNQNLYMIQGIFLNLWKLRIAAQCSKPVTGGHLKGCKSPHTAPIPLP